MSVCRDDGQLRTLLGSCIGVALYDRRQRIGGLAHIVLPESRGSTVQPGKYADTAVPELVRQMSRLADGKLKVWAKIAGGARMFAVGTASSVGEQNAMAIEKHLRQLGIAIVGRDCGGEKGRRMLLDSRTGIVTIGFVGSEPVEL